MYRCFTRDWWIDNFEDGWPNNLEPFGAGEQITRATFETEAEAIAVSYTHLTLPTKA